MWGALPKILPFNTLLNVNYNDKAQVEKNPERACGITFSHYLLVHLVCKFHYEI